MPAEPLVVFITRKWAPAQGGMETYSVRLTDALAKLVPVEVIALAGRPDGMPPGMLALLLFPFTVVSRLLQRRGAAEVIHLGDMALWPLGLLAWRRKLVLSAHGTDVAYHRRGGWRGRAYGTYLALGARLLRRARVLANSQATARMLAETGWRAHAVIPLATSALATTNLAAAGGERAILFAGRLVRRKGCGWFIANVLPLLEDSMVLKVAGAAWDESELQALAHPRVRHLGVLGPVELAREYAGSLCVIVPNIDVPQGEYEGFGLVAPEAAAAGGVVLAAHCGGLTDAVIDGVTGTLLPSGDAPAWADAVQRIAGWNEAERAAFIAQSQARAAAHFSWTRVARQTLDAYALETISRPQSAPAAT
jgi:glycosyltransferase involved in cell wall biosynthesis